MLLPHLLEESNSNFVVNFFYNLSDVFLLFSFECSNAINCLSKVAKKSTSQSNIMVSFQRVAKNKIFS